jgi:hypothetical protein
VVQVNHHCTRRAPSRCILVVALVGPRPSFEEWHEIYNIYSVISAMFRDGKLADLIEQSPCVLDERQLGPLTDKDPEWRHEAVFTRDEVETIISDARIPPDREVVYALELLAGASGPGKPRRCAGGTTTRRCDRSASCWWRSRTTRARTARNRRRPTR